MIHAVGGIISFTDFLGAPSFRELQSIALVEQFEEGVDMLILEGILLVGAWLA